jgi:hypothetical protein
MNQHDQTYATDPQPAGYELTDGTGPHECEFCSPEPQIMPDPWDLETGDDGESAD